MTTARLFGCTLALAFGACAAPGRAHEPTLPSGAHYELCSDPQFECTPASATRSIERSLEQPIQVDTNLASPRRSPAFG
ncbi:hypothetical protein BH11MYX3_BH11MYX3_43610 [soil metagenome]